MTLRMPKQANQVRGNKIGCINYQMCPICYGCRAYNNRDEDCIICQEEGNDGSKRNFNICNKNLHESWKVNNMITKNKIKIKGGVKFE